MFIFLPTYYLAQDIDMVCTYLCILFLAWVGDHGSYIQREGSDFTAVLKLVKPQHTLKHTQAKHFPFSYFKRLIPLGSYCLSNWSYFGLLQELVYENGIIIQVFLQLEINTNSG